MWIWRLSVLLFWWFYSFSNSLQKCPSSKHHKEYAFKITISNSLGATIPIEIHKSEILKNAKIWTEYFFVIDKSILSFKISNSEYLSLHTHWYHVNLRFCKYRHNVSVIPLYTPKTIWWAKLTKMHKNEKATFYKHIRYAIWP